MGTEKRALTASTCCRMLLTAAETVSVGTAGADGRVGVGRGPPPPPPPLPAVGSAGILAFKSATMVAILPVIASALA